MLHDMETDHSHEPTRGEANIIREEWDPARRVMWRTCRTCGARYAYDMATRQNVEHRATVIQFPCSINSVDT